MAMTAKLRGLYAITPEYADGSAMLADIEAALAGGCRIVQFRDKLSDAPERVLRARALRDSGGDPSQARALRCECGWRHE